MKPPTVGLFVAVLSCSPAVLVTILSGGGNNYSSSVVSPERSTMCHYCNTASLGPLNAPKYGHTRTSTHTFMHMHTTEML